MPGIVLLSLVCSVDLAQLYQFSSISRFDWVRERPSQFVYFYDEVSSFQPCIPSLSVLPSLLSSSTSLYTSKQSKDPPPQNLESNVCRYYCQLSSPPFVEVS
jgi:hypothetical protein